MKKLIIAFFVSFALFSCSDEDVFEKPATSKIIEVESELSIKDVATGDPETVYHNTSTNVYYVNCRATGTTVSELPDGNEVIHIVTTCDVICGYFWCGTATF